jgi:hypothetical protein
MFLGDQRFLVAIYSILKRETLYLVPVSLCFLGEPMPPIQPFIGPHSHLLFKWVQGVKKRNNHTGPFKASVVTGSNYNSSKNINTI